MHGLGEKGEGIERIEKKVGGERSDADVGERNGTRQLISGTGSLPGGSPDAKSEGKFNVETPGFLKLEINEIKNKVVAEYTFVQAQDNQVLWKGLKIGNGIRKNN